MNNLNEIYVATKDKEYVLAKIEGLCQKYNSWNGVNYEQQKALFRSYCHDTIEVFRECFETTMLGSQSLKSLHTRACEGSDRLTCTRV